MLCTGDAFLTKGSGFISLLIRLGTFAWFRWNHVASVVFENGTPFIYEVTASVDRPDVKFGDMRAGARKEPLAVWLKAQRGKVWHLKISSQLSAAEAKRFHNCWEDLHHDRVSYDFPGAFLSAMPGSARKKLRKTFCSAAHMMALVASSLLAPRTNYSEYHPNDVAKLEIYRKPKLVDRLYLRILLTKYE